METSLHTPQRRLIELRMAHAELDGLIDAQSADGLSDQLVGRRLKKERLRLRDQIFLLESSLAPKEPA